MADVVAPAKFPDLVTYIDKTGKAHPALVLSVRKHIVEVPPPVVPPPQVVRPFVVGHGGQLEPAPATIPIDKEGKPIPEPEPVPVPTEPVEKVYHEEPLLTISYNPGDGVTVTLIDVPHALHPLRAESNPELKHNPVNCWDYVGVLDGPAPLLPEHGVASEDGPTPPIPESHPNYVNPLADNQPVQSAEAAKHYADLHHGVHE